VNKTKAGSPGRLTGEHLPAHDFTADKTREINEESQPEPSLQIQIHIIDLQRNDVFALNLSLPLCPQKPPF